MTFALFSKMGIVTLRVIAPEPITIVQREVVGFTALKRVRVAVPKRERDTTGVVVFVSDDRVPL
jgi:hypothetical protein